jgi:hypothetical protein
MENINYSRETIPDIYNTSKEENRFADEKELKDTKYSIFTHKLDNTDFTIDRPPFDGLTPSELTNRLNYIYYATANPLKYINYHDFKTHADKYLYEDKTQLSTNDTTLQKYSQGFYPQLSSNQIDAKDCLNYGSDIGSCFQSPQLFYNKEQNFNILNKGVNPDNTNLIIREDFSMPMLLDTTQREYNSQILFKNAPGINQNIALDTVSNEYIKLQNQEIATCRNCKLAICKDDYCGLQNNLFQ